MIVNPARLRARSRAALPALLTLTTAVALAACSGGATAAPITPSSPASTAAGSVAPTGEAPATQAPASAAPSAAPSAAASAVPSGSEGGVPAACPTSPPAPMAAGDTATVTLTTDKGDIVIKVEGSLGPNAAGNFVALADCGYFDGVVFHRLVPGFVIQGGDGQYGRAPNVDPQRVGTGGPGYEFADDPVNVPYARGTVAMANSGADTNGSQFFICLEDLSTLPPNYSVFGHVTAGMDVVDAIAAMPNSGAPNNQALDPVAITKAAVARP